MKNEKETKVYWSEHFNKSQGWLTSDGGERVKRVIENFGSIVYFQEYYDSQWEMLNKVVDAVHNEEITKAAIGRLIYPKSNHPEISGIRWFTNTAYRAYDEGHFFTTVTYNYLKIVCKHLEGLRNESNK